MATTLDDAWVDALVAASGRAVAPSGRSAVAEFTIGKTQRAVVEIVDGRVVGPATMGDGDEADISVPLTGPQLDSFVDGSESMSKAYMRGDLKPVGATGALLAVFALFDDPAFRQALSP